MKSLALATLSTAALLMSSPAFAQANPVAQEVTITFSGTVISTAEDTLMIRDASGTVVPFTGTLPDYPIKVGDPFSLSTTATLPTPAFFDEFGAQTRKDGLVGLRLQPSFYNGPRLANVGNLNSLDVSAPFAPTSYFNQPTNLVLTVAVDPETGEAFIDHMAGIGSNAYAAPGLFYNAATGTFENCGSPDACAGDVFDINGGRNDPTTFRFTGNNDGTGLSAAARVLTTDNQTGEGSGFFEILFSGDWNLPSVTSRNSGPGTPVPAPPMMILFGLAAAAMLSRRRKRTAA